MGKLYCKIEHKWCKGLKKGVCTWCNKSIDSLHRCPRVEKIETIRFYNIIKTVIFDDVFAEICKWYKDQKSSIEGYRNVFNTLLSMTPHKHHLTDLFINVERGVEPDGTVWIDVDGVTFDKSKRYGIEFVPWIDWVSMFITQESLDNFTAEEIVGACLYEMTFFGFTENKVQDMKEDLIKSIEECKNKNK